MKMSDYISRADVFEIIDKAFSQPMRNGVAIYADICLMLNALPTHANSRSTHERDYISRADAIDAVCRTRCGDKAKGCPAHSCLVIEEFDAIPSADAVEVDRTSEWVAVRREEYEDLIADAVHGEWKFVDHEVFAGEYFCSICGKRAEVDLYGEWILSNYCGHCGARMKGGDGE